MYYYAKFTKHEHHLFRLDTRIYLRANDSPQNGDLCLAAVIGKNPGSAKPKKLDRLTDLSRGKDKLLPNLKNRFLAAYKEADVIIPNGAYVRVWNLLDLCDPTLADAIRAFQGIKKPMWWPTEGHIPPIVWFAWGPSSRKLDCYKKRFLNREYEFPFYSHMDTKVVVAEIPAVESRVKHTQGMKALPVETHLAGLIAG